MRRRSAQKGRGPAGEADAEKGGAYCVAGGRENTLQEVEEEQGQRAEQRGAAGERAGGDEGGLEEAVEPEVRHGADLCGAGGEEHPQGPGGAEAEGGPALRRLQCEHFRIRFVRASVAAAEQARRVSAPAPAPAQWLALAIAELITGHSAERKAGAGPDAAAELQPATLSTHWEHSQVHCEEARPLAGSLAGGETGY